MAYDSKLKNKALRAIETGLPRNQVAKKFKIRSATLNYWIKKRARIMRLDNNVNEVPMGVSPMPKDLPIHPLAVENAKLRHLLVNSLLEMTKIQ